MDALYNKFDVLNNNPRMRMLSICSGIGGFDLAAEWAGMEVVGQVEIDPFCQKVLAKHWPNVKRIGDVNDVKGDEFGAIDIICAGIPCQPFSFAGKRRGNTDDRAIWPSVLSVIARTKPRYVVIENVVGFIDMALDGVLASLEAEGYEAWPVVFPACSVGAWHIRQRVFIVAHTDRRGGESSRQSKNKATSASASVSIGNDVAYAECLRSDPHVESAKEWGWTNPSQLVGMGSGITDVPNASGAQFNGRGIAWNGRDESANGNQDDANSHGSGRKEFNPSRVAGDAGFDTRGIAEGRDYWATEPAVGRVANGIPDRTHRLKALGNAVVPQQVYPILKLIANMETQAH